MAIKVSKIKQKFVHWYNIYELTSSLCMLEPWEKALMSKFFNFS